MRSCCCACHSASPGAVCDLSRKFGCDPEDLLELARLARKLAIPVRGLSFHVGSQAADAGKHVEAIEACGKLIAAAKREKLGVFDTLDIGGGFPIEYAQKVTDIGRFCAPIRAALAKLPRRAARHRRARAATFPGPRPSACRSVMGRAQREGHWWYYLDDGLYGSYSGQLFDHAKYPVESLKESDEKFASVLAGPTCDSIDVIAENLMLPALKAGDLIVGRAMGAYTRASASEFNFFPKATVVSVNRQARRHGLCDSAAVLILAAGCLSRRKMGAMRAAITLLLLTHRSAAAESGDAGSRAGQLRRRSATVE